MSNRFKLQQNRISRRVVGNNGLGGGVPIWAQSTQKMLTPPPHILGGEVLLIWTKTPYISQRGGHRIKVRGYSAQGGLSTITREGGNSAIQGELCGKNHENSLPPLFQYFRGKVLMVWTGLLWGGGDISWFLPHNSLWTAELFPSDHCSPPLHYTPADFNPLSIPDCV